jgi:hypothetical protein
LGYPLSGLLATTANLSVGNVSALAGLDDDSRYVQISAPVQPGNSGGPLLDASGHLLGIVTAKLNAIRVARFTGDIPQNVNFALKVEVVRTFLDGSNQTPAERANEVLNFCRELYKDKRLDAIRGVIAFEAPTFSQQRNTNFIRNEQRPALDAFKELNEQCRNKIAQASPRSWKIVQQLQPEPYADLGLLYDRKITIGEYNTRKQKFSEKLQAVVAEQVR